MATKSLITAWLIIAKNNLQNQLLTPSASSLFVVGKLVTFVFTVFTVFAIFSTTKSIGSFTLNQAIIVVIVYNLVDSFTQFLFRSIYSFRPILLRGEFDLDLLKPLPSFFRPLLSNPDFLDLPSITLQLTALGFFIIKLNINPSPVDIFNFLALFVISVIVAFSLHLLMAAFSILTTEIDNIAGIYRSFIRSGIVPTDIYSGTFRLIIDYLIPVTILVTIPAKAILGLLTVQSILYTAIFSLVLFTASILFWRHTLRYYTSTGS
ncbi:hypothetical protein A3K55_00565 [Candidatus Shapirobacteria bacterium RBG_13_44_7]|uniref:ABC transporter permease n=1 Tax=Candidatus Shapirobacteria bacterium RBG_13_44_7 TaxID=1802149 RepID=A0A1F7SEX5_9BACT|nr:MAG: hypothetical protein A3K55_00565 [Candidatus Shapirobacteria bacterium RBG_13_44_7]